MILAPTAMAAPYHADHAHEDHRWRTIETRFFRVHYAVSEDRRAEHAVDTSRTAQAVARVADGLLLALSDHAGTIARGPVHVLVTDHADGMTAFTLPQWGWIVLSADPGTEVLRLRGRLDWAEDALAHELGHLVGHRAAGSLALGVSTGMSLEGMAEHGAVGVGVELPIGPNEPYGWSEGVAESWSEAIGVNRWTSARAALLRTSAIEGRLLEWDEWLVAVDKGDTFDSERAYQQGYAFARWLARREGRDVFVETARIASERYRPSWARVLERATGEDARTLWAAWRADETVRAIEEAARIRAQGAVEGEPAERSLPAWRDPDPDAVDRWRRRPRRDREEAREAGGTYELWPRTSADGRWFAEGRVGWIRVSATAESSFPGIAGAELDWATTSARRADADRDTAWLPATFGSAFAFVPGHDALVVAAPEGAERPRWLPDRADRWSRLYRVDLERDRRQLDPRLTPIPGTLRARDPAVSPDGRRLAWVAYGDGATELVVADLDGAHRRALSSFGDGTWLASPSWSPDGEDVVVSAFREGRGDLWTVHVADGGWTRLTDGEADELDPSWASDGIWFTSDPDGVRDVYRLADGRVERMTRVIGGAACPSATASGNLLYTATTAYGLQAMAVARDELLFAPTDAIGLARERIEPLSAPEPLPSRPYDAARSVLVPTIAPIVRLDWPDRPVPLAGAYVRARDAAERLDLAVLGLVGEDLYGHARLVWRGLGPDLAVWATGERDRRLPDVHRGVGALGASLAGRIADGAELRAGPSTLALWTGGLQLRSNRLSLAFSSGLERERGDRGLSVEATLTRAWSSVPGTVVDDGERLADYAFSRLELGLDGAATTAVAWGPLDEHHHRLEGTLYAGVTSRNVARDEELAAGGDVPGALRLGAVEASIPLPGYAPYALSGEALAVGGLRWVLPIAPRIRSGGGALYASSLEAALGGDVGSGWSAGVLPVLTDAVAEVRLRAVLLDARWDSVVRFAWGFGDPGPAWDVAPEPGRPPAGPRVTIGLGTGF